MAQTRNPSRKAQQKYSAVPLFQRPIHPQSAISAADFSIPSIRHILLAADAFENENPLRRARLLAKRRVALLFYEASTRTRTSFELAAKALGADTTLVSSLSSSIEKGESLKDTGITLKALGAECIILRSPYSGAPYLLARATGLPVLNAGDGMAEHPSQALLDLRTILRYLAIPATAVTEKCLRGVTLTICGDILHSRVARSNALLLPRLGAKLILCGPPELLPECAAGIAPGIAVERDFDGALRRSGIVMMLRIQAERLAGLSIDLDDYRRRYQANAERIEAYAPKALIMHPGPVIRGMEITAEVADGMQSAIAEQVHHGVPIRMALVARSLSTPPEEGEPL
ncbi:MAG TPA: aspartate carbamoyltransferase catalytic subunit [Acidobacteriaceae bacterium]|jgi:aspartate carbamoyltransferase catalytic subunit|nr:aspartate carbamoyltransferase catalytic subunit [Acidobacteriaceae bacterium]